MGDSSRLRLLPPIGDVEEPTSEPTTRRSARPPSDLAEQSGIAVRTCGDSERYGSVELLGAGAMGAVHLCRDRRIGRDVAMKVMHPRSASEVNARLRFEQEARVQGQLEHPAIVPVHDLGIAPDGSTFFTMKRVQGSSLRAILNGLRSGDPEMVAQYGRRRLLAAFGTVCLAVAFAHSRGVIHRDIKPSNIMLGDFGEVYLLDWGVAKVRPPGEARADAVEGAAVDVPCAFLNVTQVGDLLGTVGYMAPEQIRGEEVDERVDIYALGATLFELLTLESLHPRSAAASIQSTMRGVEARASIRAPLANVPPELEELCVRATALDRNQRPSSARTLHEAIERVLDGDRDIALRRQMAAEHAARGRMEALRALPAWPGSRDARERAVEEAHRAIALDPSNEEAVSLLAELASDAYAPRVAESVLSESTTQVRRLLARTGLVLFVPWLCAIAISTCLGIRSAAPFLLTLLAIAAAATFAWFRARVDNMWVTFGTLVTADAAAALSAAWFGPFLLMPGLLASNALAFTIASWPSRWSGGPSSGKRFIRDAAIVISIVSFLAPMALEAMGVLPPSIAFRDGTIVLLPRAVDFPPALTLVMLLLANLILILVPAFIATRVREHVLRLERHAFESAAKLRQLLPREAQALVDRPPFQREAALSAVDD